MTFRSESTTKSYIIVDLSNQMQPDTVTVDADDLISLRFSKDYDPAYNRYSRDDEFEEITLILEDLIPDTEDKESQEVNIQEENEFQKINFILRESKELGSGPETGDKQPGLKKKMSLNRNSLRIKKKISLKTGQDAFSNKYDELFDQIFNDKKDKLSEQAEAKGLRTITEASEAPSQVSTVINQLANISLKGSQVTNTSFSGESTAPETKINIKIDPSKLHSDKPFIKFNYGEKKTQKQNVPLVIESSLKEQSKRIPAFLRKVREYNSFYPNLYDKAAIDESFCSKLNQDFKEELVQIKKALQSLKGAHIKVHDIVEMRRHLYEKMTKNILEEGSKHDQELLEVFLSSKWEEQIYSQQIQLIRPKDSFANRNTKEKEIATLIHSFEEIVESLQEVGLKNETEESVKIYMTARDQLWAIEKNMRIISEDLYMMALNDLTLPLHIAQARRAMLEHKNQGKITKSKQNDKLLETLEFFTGKRDIFSTSCLGAMAIAQLKQAQ